MKRFPLILLFTLPLYAVMPLSITSGAPPEIQAGANYSYALAAAGGYPPYQWSASTWALQQFDQEEKKSSAASNRGLPTGIVIDKATGLLHGKSSQRGRYMFTVVCKDSKNNTADMLVSVIVR